MTEEQIEQIAEAVFQKILAKQDEWEKQFYSKADRDELIAEIVKLNIFKIEAVESEDYEKASEIQKQINKLRESLNNQRLE
jgi:protein-arginine kinase activator protein McsA